MAKVNPPIKKKKIATPELLYQHFQQYKKATKSNPFKVTDWVGGMAKQVVRTKERPLSLDGFEVWCYHQNIIADLGKYFANKDNAYEGYRTICAIIRQEIREDQVAGGMAGIYNPSITQRLNNLVEKTQTEIVEQPLFPNE